MQGYHGRLDAEGRLVRRDGRPAAGARTATRTARSEAPMVRGTGYEADCLSRCWPKSWVNPVDFTVRLRHRSASDVIDHHGAESLKAVTSLTTMVLNH